MPELFKAGCKRPESNNPVKVDDENSTVNETTEEMKSLVKLGQKAPDFELAGYQNGQFMNFKLSEYIGKWVLLCFYPGDFTFVWATEVSAVAAKYEELKSLGAEVLSVSVDSIFVHKMWNDHELSKMVKGGIPYPMLSDAGGSVGTMYNVYDENSGVENRGRFIIDPDGLVQGYEVLTPPVGRNVSESIRQLKAFQLVRESKGTEATPSGWKPGKTTLKPGPELVGNVWKAWKVEEADE